MEKYKDIIANTIIDEKKTYQDNKKLCDFFEHKADFGVAIIKCNRVLFAKNYKSRKKAEEAYETILNMAKVYGYKPDNELTICMWNCLWAYNAYCLYTEEVIKIYNEIHNKWIKFIFEETNKDKREQIKEIHINKKNYNLLSKHYFGLDFTDDFNIPYPIIIDDNITESLKVIYKEA